MTDPIARRRAFVKERNLTIGFTAIADFSSFIGQEYLAGIMRAAEDYGAHFINMADAVRHTLFTDAHFLPQYLTKRQFMRAPLVDGMVTWASSLSDYLPADEIQAFFSALKPLPLVDIGYLDIPDVPSIRIDNGYSMHLLVRHLAEAHGCTRIVFVGAKTSRPHELRRDCFVREMAARGLPCTDADIFMADSLDEKDVAAQVEKLLAPRAEQTERTLPHAIVTSSDIIAAAVINELEKRGISVPDDVVVTGFNNQLAGITAPCPVTTIDLAYFTRGYQAVELLLDRIQFSQLPTEQRTVKTSLLVRQSCGCFEQGIMHALTHHATHSAPAADAPQAALRAYLTATAQDLFPHESTAAQTALADALTKTIQILPPPERYWSGSERCVRSVRPTTMTKKLPRSVRQCFRWLRTVPDRRAV